MKKKLLICLFIFACVFCLTACNSSKNSKDKEFTITCEGENKQNETVQKTTITNKFDYNDQYTKYSELVIEATYEKEDEYKASKAVYEKMVATDDKNHTYKLDANDSARTIKYSYTITYDKEELLKKDDKDNYKAINVLKSTEESGSMKCTIDGIKREDIK